MNWNYKNWLKEKIAFICQDLGISDLRFDIVDEQEYAKINYYSPETIYIVIKKYNANVEYKTTIQPIQILVLSEEFSLESITMILNKFVNDYQYHITDIKNENNSYTYIKHVYQKPAVMTNFIEVGAGRRSVLYIPVTLTILEDNISLIRDLKVRVGNGEFESIKALSLSIAYNMQGNTQQLPSKHLSETVKSVAITSLSFTVQAISDSNFIENVLEVMFGNISGNISYTFELTGNKTIVMKLNNVTYSDAPDSAPSLQLGFTV